MIVIYAEKPDMGEKIAKALGGSSFNKSQKKQGYYTISYKGREYSVTWGYGHLCCLADAPEYNESYKKWSNIPSPFIPDDYKIVLNTKSRNPVAAAYKIVKKLFQSAEYLINATDFDREGELIFWYLYQYMGCRKPVMRAKLTSTTDSGIHDAFDNLMESESFAGLLSSARCRSIADWVVGINLTVAMTLRSGNGNVCSIGRVQTPTLDMIVKRDEEIANFKPENYYTVDAVFTKQDTKETYKGSHETKRFKTRDEAQAVLQKCANHNGIVSSIENTESQKAVPHLYNMDTLQMDANGKLGMSLQAILDTVQSLYEKGFVTYPRTDCQFLPEDMVDRITQIQDMLKANGYSDKFNENADASNMLKNKRTFFDDSKLGSHFAIIPTEKAPSGLDGSESKIYDMIADSVIRMLYPPARIGRTTVITSVNGENFVTKGTMILSEGWMSVDGKTVDEESIPSLKEGEEVDAACRVESRQTKPPKHYTDKTILGAMVSAGKNLEDDELKAFMLSQDNPGIGTVATRAGILETLISRGYVKRDRKNILATPTGISLIHAIPVDQVKSAEMTAVYEKRLNEIVEGRDDTTAFLNDIYKDVGNWCSQIHEIPQEQIPESQGSDLKCPVCGSPLVKYKWGYGCSKYNNGDGCRFSIGKISGKLLTERQMKNFLSDGEIGPLKFKRKDGTSFTASLVLVPVVEKGEVVSYQASFKEKPSLQETKGHINALCPQCHTEMVNGKWGWECSNQCGFSIGYTIAGHDMTVDEAETLLTNGEIGPFNFKKKDGTSFTSSLQLQKQDSQNAYNSSDYKIGFKRQSFEADPKNDMHMNCPKCGGKMIQGKWGWYCSNRCGFQISYVICNHKLSAKEADTLLDSGEAGPFDFQKKDGTKFNSTLQLSPIDGDDGSVDYKVEFKRNYDDSNRDYNVGIACPACGSPLYKGKWGWYCSKKCGFSIPFTLSGHTFTENEMSELVTKGSLPLITDFVSKNNKPFSAVLSLKEDGSSVQFNFQN